MGTRHLIIVYYKGKCRVAQYGQRNGFPDGQGLAILRFVSNTENISKLRAVLNNADRMLYKPTQAQLDAWAEASDNLQRAEEEIRLDETSTQEERDAALQRMLRNQNPYYVICPSLSRDAVARILTIVAEATEPVPIVKKIEFIQNSCFCEWAYVVDLDESMIEVYQSCEMAAMTRGDHGQKGYTSDEGHGTGYGRLEHLAELEDSENLPVRVGRFRFDALPDEKEFVANCHPREEDEDEVSD